MPRVYVSLGSNIEPAANIAAAQRALAARFGPLEQSRVYESRAVGFAGDNFYNQVVGFDTDEPPAAVADALHAMEDAQGRRRGAPRFSARTLDLDLLLYGDQVLDDGRLHLPRPEILAHAFVLRPLAEIAGERVHPVAGRTYAELWAAFDDPGQDLWPVEPPAP